MPKQSQLERAIAAIEQDIQVLQLAKAKLQAQIIKVPVRKPRAVPVKEQSA